MTFGTLCPFDGLCTGEAASDTLAMPTLRVETDGAGLALT